MNHLRTLTVVTLLLIPSLSTTASVGLKDHFVDTQWLDSNREKVVVVDVRNPARYLLGHIEGAINIHRGEFLSTRHGTKSPVPTADEFGKLMDRNGITPETMVVAYAQNDNETVAARIERNRLP